MPAGPFQNIIMVENASFMSLKDSILLQNLPAKAFGLQYLPD